MANEKVGRNDPCRCGSGSKYKRCCLPKDEAQRRASSTTAGIPAGARVVKRNVEQLLVSESVTDESLAEHAEYFETKRRHGRPVRQMKEFIEPLLEKTDGSPEAVDPLWMLGSLCWNLALADAESRETAMADAERALTEDARPAFRELAGYLIERHKLMFPELHAGTSARS